MSTDLWQQLASEDVPPPPVEFDHQLHQRVNKSLVLMQVLDFALRGLPWAMLHFAHAVLGAVAFTLAGDYPDKPKPQDR